MKVSLLRKRHNLAILSFILFSSLPGKPLFARSGEYELAPTTHITVTASASNSGVLTCTHLSTTITASTTASGTTTYSWTGPNGFTATGASITVSTVGTYTVTGTNSSKTGSASVTVTSNKTAPPVLTPGNTGPLTCSNPSASLVMPFGSLTDVTVSWGGPNGFTSTDAFPVVSVPGTYNLVITYNASGCFSLSPTIVVQDTTAPAGLAIASNTGGKVLNCTNSSITLTANSSTSGVGFNWTGPNGFSSSASSISVASPGNYNVTATNTSNGCMSTSSTALTMDTAHPAAVVTSSVPANGQLTCSIKNVILTGSSSTSGVTYSWTGPSGFTAAGASATVSTAGNYTVTVANPNNGCSTSVTAATVTQNTTVPGAVSATVSNKLTCSAPSATLSGSSSTGGVTYAWAGPNGFSSSSSTATATDGGLYTLTATDPTNGCSFSASITVQADKAPPQGVTATSEGNLSCTVGSVTLTGNSTTSGVTYSWAGPNGFVDPEKVVSAVDSGTYFLTVKNPANSCTAVASVVVTADFTECSMVAPKTVSGDGATLDASAGKTSEASGFTYKTYPNPMNTTAVVALTSPERTHVSVEVYNSVGVHEKVLFDGMVDAGTPYQWTLDASRLAAGVHYCILRTSSKTYTSKLLIISKH